MRYAIFSDIHANLEALEAVLAKIDELAQEEPIEQIWFLGDLVGYGPDPNECILKLRERTDVIIAGNHDWAAVGKIDLEDFSAAARISAEWTAEQLTEEHREFLTNLPERLAIDECTLVHGSPYGPLWEYLTSEVLAERSFQYFSSRYCLVGHTHVPVIFQQPDTFSNAPTLPLQSDEPTQVFQRSNGIELRHDNDDETEEMIAVQTPIQQATLSAKENRSVDSAFRETENDGPIEVEEDTKVPAEENREQPSDEQHDHLAEETKVEEYSETTINGHKSLGDEAISSGGHNDALTNETAMKEASAPSAVETEMELEKTDLATIEDDHDVRNNTGAPEDEVHSESEDVAEDFAQDRADPIVLEEKGDENSIEREDHEGDGLEISLEPVVVDSDDQLNGEIEELLTLLGLSQSMVQVTNEMITPPEGLWEPEDGYRAIINPGGVGQPRDGDPRAAFMIYDTERGFEFYRVPYEFEKTQEKIIKAGLPQYLAVRLEYGR